MPELSSVVSPPPGNKRQGWVGAFAIIALFAALIWLGWSGFTALIAIPAKLATFGLAATVFAAITIAGFRRFIYRIGRRLMVSYFLVGIVPIPLLALLLLLGAYQLNGFFVGHLYRDALRATHEQLQREAETAIDGGKVSKSVAAAVYRNSVRVSGSSELPRKWPAWIAEKGNIPFVTASDLGPTIAALSGDKDHGAIAVWAGNLPKELSTRSGVWISLLRSDQAATENSGRTVLTIGSYSFPLRTSGYQKFHQTRQDFFNSGAEDSPGILRRPFLWWGELGGPLYDLASGDQVSDQVAAGLNANLKTSFERFFSSSAEIDTTAWLELTAALVVGSAVYAIAVFIAGTLVFGVSRAVNRLSHATNALRQGDFSARIPVRRKDQIGDLQRSFNAMAADLENLVATAAQKEALDSELEVARDLQQSLLPASLPSGDQVEFSTLFEPSAAIGGDFFDVVRLDETRLAVVVADVAGHGLPTGLRMAMFKAALEILIADRKPIETILTRLSSMIRGASGRRYFVTAAISIIDLKKETLSVTNAGHPPVYRKRGDQVTEVLIPGTALGTLDDNYGRKDVGLAPGDFVVWMSDGLIEATGPSGDVFGYDRIMEALAKPAETAAMVQSNLLSTLRDFTQDDPAEDDRTLVVMRYRTTTTVV